jgi:hypothetical protein
MPKPSISSMTKAGSIAKICLFDREIKTPVKTHMVKRIEAVADAYFEPTIGMRLIQAPSSRQSHLLEPDARIGRQGNQSANDARKARERKNEFLPLFSRLQSQFLRARRPPQQS